MRRLKRTSGISFTFYDPFTEKILGVIRHNKYDPVMMLNGSYRIIIEAWIKTFSGVLRRSGELHTRVKFKLREES